MSIRDFILFETNYFVHYADFNNYYRWIGGQEPKDGLIIKSVKFTSKNKALVSIEYYILVDKVKEYAGKNEISLKNLKNSWEIDNIQSARVVK